MTRTSFLRVALFCLMVSTGVAQADVRLQILNGGEPLANTSVEILSSSGTHEVTTDANGRVSLAFDGTCFRVRLNGTTLPTLHVVDAHQITIDVTGKQRLEAPTVPGEGKHGEGKP